MIAPAFRHSCNNHGVFRSPALSPTMLDPRSSGKHNKKPLGDQPSVTFDVVKVNSHGKRQNRSNATFSLAQILFWILRQLNFAPDGVRNMSGSSVQWFIDSDDVFRFGFMYCFSLFIIPLKHCFR